MLQPAHVVPDITLALARAQASNGWRKRPRGTSMGSPMRRPCSRSKRRPKSERGLGRRSGACRPVGRFGAVTERSLRCGCCRRFWPSMPPFRSMPNCIRPHPDVFRNARGETAKPGSTAALWTRRWRIFAKPERICRLRNGHGCRNCRRNWRNSTQRYSENVLDATNAWQLVVNDERRLAGLPAHAVAAAQPMRWRNSSAQPSNRSGASHCRCRHRSRS